MLKKEKTENRSGYQNRKTGNFECKNRKTDLKNDQNRKTENPNEMYTALFAVNVIADSKSANLTKIAYRFFSVKFRQTKKTIFHVWKPTFFKIGKICEF